jgi:hypothetical protein
MNRPLFALAVAGLVSVSGCGLLQTGQRNEPEPDYDDPGGYRDTGSARVNQTAIRACKNEIVGRWRMPESRVHTSGRSTNADGESLVNWEIDGGGSGYCRVASNGDVTDIEVEQNRDQRADDGYGTDPFPRDTEDVGSREVRPAQVRACRDMVVRQYNARASDVGLSAGEVDDRGMAFIEWTLNNGTNGSCLVDEQSVVVSFRSR